MMKRIYYFMDLLFDPPPKEIKDQRDKAGMILYYETEDESYTRYKHLCYRNLILEALVSFVLALFVGSLIFAI